MDLQRELIYEDRKRIEEFSVDDMSSINYLLYEDWLPTLTDLQPTESGYLQRTLKAFNDAYYICTLILMHKTNEDFLSYAYKRCSIPSIVFPMAYFYISKIREKGRYLSRLLKTIKTAFYEKGWSDNFETIQSLIKKTSENFIPLSVFIPRTITSEILDSIKWYKVTNKFKKEDTLKILKYVAKNQTEWEIMVDAIKNAAKEYEDEYNRDLDYVDDLGNWCKDKPLCMKSFYSFCDEIRNQYDNYRMPVMSIEQNEEVRILSEEDNILDQGTKVGRPKAKPFMEFIKRGTPDCFMQILSEMMNGKTGIDAARIICACKGHWIQKPQIKSVINEFPSVKKTSFSTAFNDNIFSDEELASIRAEIEEKIEQNNPHNNA
jgi:hypothetical protein